MPIEIADAAVIAALETGLLHPRVLTVAVTRVAARLCDARGEQYANALRRELATVEQDLSNLTTAVAGGGDVPTLVEAIRSRESQRCVLRDQLAHDLEILDLDPASVLAEVQARLADWRALLRDHTPQARGLLKQLIVGRLEMEADRGKGLYRFHGTGTLLPLVSGIIPPFVPQSVASPTELSPFTVAGSILRRRAA